ncbi:MAG TPA: hypothetical protein VFU51_10235 [Gaiellaceae bacterium]|nr:hypothetical protein [Gaiellaceae bacterium]
MSQPSEPLRLRGFALVVVLSVMFGVWAGGDLGGRSVVRYFDDLATVAAALAAAVLCARAARSHADGVRPFWWLMAAACGAWTLGEGVWGWYDLVRGSVPESSWADVGYLAALPLGAAALLVHPALHGRTVGRVRSLVDGLVLATAVLFVGWLAVLEPLRRSVDLTSRDGLVTISYPIGDVVIVFLVILVMRGITSRDRADLWCLLAGLLMITCSDAGYTYLSSVRDYASGGLIDTGWFAGYLAIGLGAALRSRSFAVQPGRTSSALTPAALVAPFLPMLAALSLLAIRLESGHPLDRVSLTVAFMLVGLVLVRQALLLIDILTSPSDPGAATGFKRLAPALGRAFASRRSA